MLRIQRSIDECIARAGFASVGPDAPVAEAVAEMSKNETDCVLVLDGDQLAGIFTERDFLHRISAAGLDPAATSIRDVMTSEVQTLRGTDCVTYAIDRMAMGGFRNVPIVDENGVPTSVLDVRNVMAHVVKVFAESEREDQEVGDEWIDIGGG